MRNLILGHRGIVDVESRTAPDLPLVGSVFDPVSESMICCFSDQDLFEIQQISKSPDINILSTFESPSDRDPGELIDFKFLGDLSTAIIVLSNGYIISWNDDDVKFYTPIENIDGAEWSPDEEVLALVGDSGSKLVLLSRSLEQIAQYEITSKDLSLSKNVSVGWGKKETQFQGRGAKALRDPTMPEKVDSGAINQNDEGKIRISWRGDGEYLAVSKVDDVDSDLQRRTIRVFSRAGTLDSMSEPVDHLDDLLSWRPSGNLIASVQRYSASIDNQTQVVFFERNGLRRGEFSLGLRNHKVIDMAWNVDSTVLAVLLDSRVQLWTTKNYHWYLKHELVTRDITKSPQEIFWHPEKPLSITLICENGHLETAEFGWDILSGSNLPPFDIGTTIVIDGTNVNVTPFRLVNTPPPMYFRQLQLGEVPTHVAVNKDSTIIAAISNQHLQIASWSPLSKPVPPISLQAKIPLNMLLEEDERPKQLAFIDTRTIVIVSDAENGSLIIAVDIGEQWDYEIVASHYIQPDIFLLKPQTDDIAVIFETVDAAVYRLTADFEIEPVSKLPQLCASISVSTLESEDIPGSRHITFGLTSKGKLYANERLLENVVTSFTITQSHIIFTTGHNFIKFCHLSSDENAIVIPSNDVSDDERCRAIERGSLLVSVIPSKTCLVLQADRGNLETVFPRMMVLSGIRRYIQENRYDLAFTSCRIHRVDFNFLHDYDPVRYHENTELFIQQLSSVEYLDLFLSGLRDEDVSKTMYKETIDLENPSQDITADLFVDKTNRICDGILKILSQSQYKQRYYQTILTAYACKSPSDLESALTLVGQDRVGNPDQAETSIQHLCFLQDVNLLYDTSLGLYDLHLALLVAQQSQKDPKEYLPFLRNLQEQEPLRAKFLIDTHLKRYEKAVAHLSDMAGEEAFDELKDYVVDHHLYQKTLQIYRYDQVKQNEILKLFASYLQGQTLYSEAGVAYENLELYEDALDMYQLAGDWKEALAIAEREEFGQARLKEVAEHLAQLTSERSQYEAAASIYLEYLDDVSSAVSILCKGLYFSEAIRIALRNKQKDLVKSSIHDGLAEGFSQVSELLSDCKAQIDSQVRRIDELREKKASDPLAFFGDGPEDSDAPDNISIAPTESSTAPSFFTRYTGKTAGTAKTGASRRTAKNRRREERKKARGKKGSIYEEEYLMNSMVRLVQRLDDTQAEAHRLIQGLIRCQMKDHAYQVQKSYKEVIELLDSVVDKVFNQTEKDLERYDQDGNIYHVEPISKPKILRFELQKILDF